MCGARLPLLRAEDLASADAELVASGNYVHRVLANSPGVARAVRSLTVYLRRDSPLDQRLRELVILQICYVTKAEYEYAHHVWRALDLGIAEADIAAVAIESAGRQSHLGELERTAMAAGRELTENFDISDATFDRLRQWLDAARLADLVVLISTYSAINRICAGLKIEVEPDFMTYLKRFPIA